MKHRKVTIIPGTGSPIITSKKVGRNDLCKCGSKKKAKNCCGTDVKYYASGKLKAIKRNEKIAEIEREDQAKKVIL